MLISKYLSTRISAPHLKCILRAASNIAFLQVTSMWKGRGSRIEQRSKGSGFGREHLDFRKKLKEFCKSREIFGGEIGQQKGGGDRALNVEKGRCCVATGVLQQEDSDGRKRMMKRPSASAGTFKTKTTGRKRA